MGEITVVTENPIVILYRVYNSLALVCVSTKRHARGTRSGIFSDFTDYTDRKFDGTYCQAYTIFL